MQPDVGLAGRGTVLVVGQEPSQLGALRDNLLRAGCAVVVAGDGLEAARIVTERDLDLVLLDARLFDISSYEVARRIREASAVPITILLPAHAEDDDKVACFEAGADAYIARPFSTRELMARVNAAIRRRRAVLNLPAINPVLQVGHLSVDDREKKVSWRGHKLDLSPTEYRLLWALAENADRLVRTARLQELVWGSAGFGEEGRLRAAIARLRQRLGDRDEGVIIAKRGYGYSFISDPQKEQHQAGPAAENIAAQERNAWESVGTSAYLKLLAEISGLLVGSSSNVGALLRLVVRRLSETIGDGYTIRLLSDDGEVLQDIAAGAHAPRPVASDDEPPPSPALDAREGLHGRVVATGQPVLIPATTTEQCFPVPLVLQPGVSYGLLVVPVRVDGATLGTLDSVRQGNERPFGTDDQAFLQCVADLVGQALASAKLRQMALQEITGRKRAEETVRSSEARYYAILEDQAEAICRFLPDGTLTFANGSCCRYFGKTREAMIGTKYLTYVLPDDRPAVIEYLASLGPENPMGTCEPRVVLANGEVRWQQWSIRALFDRDGTVVEFQCVGRDISDRKRAEEALRQNEERLRRITDSVADVLVQVDVHGVFQYVSPSVKDILGYDPGYMLGKSAYGFLHPEDVFLAFLALADLGVTGTSKLELRCRHADGHYVWAEAAIRILGENDGRIVGLVAACRDVTDRKRIEEETRKNAIRGGDLIEFTDLLSQPRLDVGSTLASILRRSVELMADFGVVHLVSKDGRHLEDLAAYHRNPALRDALNYPKDPQSRAVDGLPGLDMLIGGQPVLQPFVPAEQYRAWAPAAIQDYVDRNGPYRVLILPLHADGSLIGTTTFVRENGAQPFTPEDQGFLRSISEILASAVAGTRPHREN